MVPEARRELGLICLIAAVHWYLSTQEFIVFRASWSSSFIWEIQFGAHVHLPPEPTSASDKVKHFLRAGECSPLLSLPFSLAGELVQMVPGGT